MKTDLFISPEVAAGGSVNRSHPRRGNVEIDRGTMLGLTAERASDRLCRLNNNNNNNNNNNEYCYGYQPALEEFLYA